MKRSESSAVLEFGAPEPGETAAMVEAKLRFHTDSWDLSVDLKAGLAGIVVIDARARDAYAACHIPGARTRHRKVRQHNRGGDCIGLHDRLRRQPARRG